jgi:hypothetical protein
MLPLKDNSGNNISAGVKLDIGVSNTKSNYRNYAYAIEFGVLKEGFTAPDDLIFSYYKNQGNNQPLQLNLHEFIQNIDWDESRAYNIWADDVNINTDLRTYILVENMFPQPPMQMIAMSDENYSAVQLRFNSLPSNTQYITSNPSDPAHDEINIEYINQPTTVVTFVSGLLRDDQGNEKNKITAKSEALIAGKYNFNMLIENLIQEVLKPPQKRTWYYNVPTDNLILFSDSSDFPKLGDFDYSSNSNTNTTLKLQINEKPSAVEQDIEIRRFFHMENRIPTKFVG